MILLILYSIPVIITTFNIINLLRKMPIKEDLVDILTFVFGIALSWLLYAFWQSPEYNQPIILGYTGFMFHAPFSNEFMPTILMLVLLSMIGYSILRIKKNELSPLISIICISMVYIGIALSIVFIIQLSNNFFTNKGTLPFDVILMTLFPLNYILCSIRLIRQVISRHIDEQKKNDIKYNNKFLQFCQQVLASSTGWFIMTFALMIPLLCILLIILILFGQVADAVIRAFTETSDWTFSQKISPPPIKYEGHYLCTAAVNGHKNIVKPTRAGIRHGVKITVNRQLCVANAFEQLIEEKTPKIHRLIRTFYDKHGYPLSKRITTPIRADIVYIVMKPLEWAFLMVLYLFDVNPENRIAMQYTGKGHESIK